MTRSCSLVDLVLLPADRHLLVLYLGRSSWLVAVDQAECDE